MLRIQEETMGFRLRENEKQIVTSHRLNDRQILVEDGCFYSEKGNHKMLLFKCQAVECMLCDSELCSRPLYAKTNPCVECLKEVH